ncbi:arginine decarboxylase, pyruvoyl-dependent [candidate division KSB1 bacterium]|nr:arginine decarboxylase, pyruvoyl-dependent [candidate division KSB1 bacterium]
MIITRLDKYFLVAGFAEGPSLLNAFDNALMAAGVGNTNIVKMSSILPPNCQNIPPLTLPYGALVPVAYAEETWDEAGVVVSAAVACGIPDDPELPGVIMEHHMRADEQACRENVIRKVEWAFEQRKFKLADLKVASASGKIVGIGSAFAGVVLWS